MCVRAVVVSHRRMRSSVTPSGHSSHNREQDKNNKIIKYLKGGNFPWRPTSPASFNNPASIIKRSQILSFIHAGHYRLPAEMGRRQRRSRRSRNLIDFTPRYLVSLFPFFNVPMGLSFIWLPRVDQREKYSSFLKKKRKLYCPFVITHKQGICRQNSSRIIK